MPEEIRVKAPWKNQLGEIPFHLDYFEGTMYEGVKKCAERFPDYVALDFMGATITYRKMLAEIDRCARAFKTIGVRKGDKVTIALPNCPQGIYAFYALNLIGAISNMVHPLSAEKELEFYINASNSQTVITLDQFYSKFRMICFRRKEHIYRDRVFIFEIYAVAKLREIFHPAARTAPEFGKFSAVDLKISAGHGLKIHSHSR